MANNDKKIKTFGLEKSESSLLHRYYTARLAAHDSEKGLEKLFNDLIMNIVMPRVGVNVLQVKGFTVDFDKNEIKVEIGEPMKLSDTEDDKRN